jgi:hypothetical protein
LRSLRLLVASAFVAAALIAPTAAQAATGYVVTLRNPVDSTCSGAILDVTMAYEVVPSRIYTSALCGFAASLPKAKARDLSLDPRVQAVEPDTPITLP